MRPPDPLYTAILSCRGCGAELNRAEHVPERERSKVIITSGFAAGSCPNGCRATFSDLNLNTTLTWELQAPASEHAEARADG